jgi:hypothetical protein
MARFHGRGGALYVDMPGLGAVPTPVVNIAKWGLDRSTPEIDVSALGDTNQTFVVGLPGSKGTFSGWMDDTASDLYAAASDGVARGFYLYAKVPKPYWYGTAFFGESFSGGVAEAAAVNGTIVAASNIFQVK